MAAVAINFRNQFRNLLGIRRARATPRRTLRPALGARIHAGDIRMVVQAGLDRELWSWLQDRGWREITVRPDRRSYRDVPNSWMTLLIDSPPEQREAVLKAAIADARRMPAGARRQG